LAESNRRNVTAVIVNQGGPFLERIENKAALASDGKIKLRCYRDRVLRRSSLIDRAGIVKPADAQARASLAHTARPRRSAVALVVQRYGGMC
jgi:hypothetical protein